MIVRFHGTRGTLPVSGRDRIRYGGNTPCLEIEVGGRKIILDAGTGIHRLGGSLDHGSKLDLDLVFTHYHWDHIQGFPFFWPIYDRNTTIRIHGLETPEWTPREVLARHMERPVFPVTMSQLPSKIYFSAVKPGKRIDLGDVTIYTAPNIHPGGCLGLRVEYKGWVFVHLTDNECPPAGLGFHQPTLELARDADVLSFDTTFTEDEYHGRVDGVSRVGWGHATDEHGVAFGQECGAKNFFLFHHAPEHDDNFLDGMARRARDTWKKARMSVDGLEIIFPEEGPRRPRFIYPPGTRPRLK
jgi:phosphoribosyl 1,2-cyclic phosphodiesterase